MVQVVEDLAILETMISAERAAEIMARINPVAYRSDWAEIMAGVMFDICMEQARISFKAGMKYATENLNSAN